MATLKTYTSIFFYSLKDQSSQTLKVEALQCVKRERPAISMQSAGGKLTRKATTHSGEGVRYQNKRRVKLPPNDQITIRSHRCNREISKSETFLLLLAQKRLGLSNELRRFQHGGIAHCDDIDFARHEKRGAHDSFESRASMQRPRRRARGFQRRKKPTLTQAPYYIRPTPLHRPVRR